MRRPPLIVVALSLAAGLGLALVAAQPPRSTVFTADQAAAGRAVYQTSCAGCHMPDLGGQK
jgi:mono/diheme cytochrome c family protein